MNKYKNGYPNKELSDIEYLFIQEIEVVNNQSDYHSMDVREAKKKLEAMDRILKYIDNN